MTIDQVEDAWLEGITDFDEWLAEFDAAFFEPVQRRMMMTMYATITEQEKEMLRKIMPEELERIEKQMEKVMEV
jgi:hypothetical protein